MEPVRFDIFMAVTMKNAVFWDVTTCGSCKNRRFGETYRLHHQGDKIGELGTTLAVTSNRSMLWSNTLSILTRATRRNISGDGILYVQPIAYNNPLTPPLHKRSCYRADYCSCKDLGSHLAGFWDRKSAKTRIILMVVLSPFQMPVCSTDFVISTFFRIPYTKTSNYPALCRV
jgi:hypothetical protein